MKILATDNEWLTSVLTLQTAAVASCLSGRVGMRLCLPHKQHCRALPGLT